MVLVPVPLPSHEKSMRFAEAAAMIEQTCGIVTPVETVSLNAARSRLLAHNIVAPISVPPANNSAVDGYAFRQSDLGQKGRTEFRLVGRAAAGHPFGDSLRPGEAVRIFTGAMMPDRADTVAMQEDVIATGAVVHISAGMVTGDNRRKAGEDIAAGSKVLPAGRRVGPAEIGLLTALGIEKIAVRAPLRVALFSTGDELIDAGTTPRPGQIYDSNRPVLLGLLHGLGMEVDDLGILPDCPETIRGGLAAAAVRHDAVICSAGMSAGDEDHIRSAVETLGTLDFWNVAIKPGRPIAVGRIGGVPFFGLPGNPAAMVVTFLMIVRPALLRLAGAEPHKLRRFPVSADFSMRKKPGRREFLRCTLHEIAGGRLAARRLQRHGSGMVSSIADSEGLLEIAEDTADIQPGMVFPFIPFGGLGL